MDVGLVDPCGDEERIVCAFPESDVDQVIQTFVWHLKDEKYMV